MLSSAIQYLLIYEISEILFIWYVITYVYMIPLLVFVLVNPYYRIIFPFPFYYTMS